MRSRGRLARDAPDARTRALTDPDHGWVRPFWLERQLESEHEPDGSGGDRLPVNVTVRNWTSIGNLASRRGATVDPRGLVTSRPGAWSLDWWIRAEDGWHVPSSERRSRVQQRLIGSAPIVETSVRVPGGHAVHRAYACIQAHVDAGMEEMLVVEIENRSPVPFAVRWLAVRPYDVQGLATVGLVGLDDGVTVTVDGTVAMVLPRPPAQTTASTLAGGDCARVVLADEAEPGATSWTCHDEGGMAHAAFVYPVPHAATLRVALPMAPVSLSHERPDGHSTLLASLPAASQVARGWAAERGAGMRLVVPDPRLQDAIDASRGFLLAQDDPPTIDAAGAVRLATLDQYGYPARVVDVLRSAPTGSDACIVWSIGEHWRLTRDADLVESQLESMAGHLARTGRTRIAIDGVDVFWRVAALQVAAQLFASIGQPEAAARARRQLEPLSARVMPVPIDGDDRFASPLHTMQIAQVQLASGDPHALDRLAWLLDVATSTWTWPGAIDLESSRGIAGDGHDRRVGTELLSFVRNLLVRERASVSGQVGTPALALCTLVPEQWIGQGVEVHDAPTHFGTLSFAVRWHGPRPALLWELAPHDAISPVHLTAPGLDPGWSSTDLAGEALLAAPSFRTGRG